MREKKLTTKRLYEVNIILKDLKLTDIEVDFIIKKNSIINRFLSSDARKILLELKKYDFTQEQIIRLIMRKAHLLNYVLRDFEDILKMICEYESCDEKTAIIEYM